MVIFMNIIIPIYKVNEITVMEYTYLYQINSNKADKSKLIYS